MKIERITREKAESLVGRLPSLGPIIPLKDENTEYYLISQDGFFSVTFDVALVEDGKVSYITDERLTGAVEAYLESK